MNFYYINSNNEKVDFSDYPYLFQEGDLLDYSWGYSSRESFNNNKIKYFNKDIAEKSFKLAIVPDFTINKEERDIALKKYADKLLEIFEYDIIKNKDGKLYTNTGYYLSCRIYASEKSSWNLGTPFMFNTLKIVSANPYWTKETLFKFSATNNNSFSTTGFDYPFDYPIDYQNSLITSQLINTGYAPADFEFTIYGPCINPAFSIGENTYSFDIELGANEYLKIIRTEGEKTITKYKQNGETENAFYTRSTDFNVFEPIPVGELNVAWEGDFDFDINLLERRSEPKWI